MPHMAAVCLDQLFLAPQLQTAAVTRAAFLFPSFSYPSLLLCLDLFVCMFGCGVIQGIQAGDTFTTIIFPPFFKSIIYNLSLLKNFIALVQH